LFSLVGALIVAVALVSASGAATTKAQKAAKIDVSTRTAVVHYLRSIHVNPKGAVIERGLRNYAGARCPGRAWSCASTRHTVVQIAKRGGQNRFICRSARCVVVQFSGISHGAYASGRSLQSTAAPIKPNKAVCIKTSGLGASCTINQSGSGPNQAVVYESAGKVTGLTQSASYAATITQQATGASSGNTACVTQNIFIDGSTTAKKGTPVSVTLEAHQSVTIKQDVLHGGANSAELGADSSGNCTTAKLGQSQTLTSTANGSGSITQNENDAQTSCPDGVSGDNANMCLDIEQNQGAGKGVATGTNNATFHQTNSLTAIANTSAGPVSQTQSSLTGGLVGTVNQDSTGISTANATQTETQCEDAATLTLSCTTGLGSKDFTGTYSLTQNQYGPEGVWKLRKTHRGRVLYSVHKGLGTATQTGNTADQFTISQSSTQDDDQGSGSTQQNNVQGDCSTPGNCTDTQTVTVNGTPSTNTQSGQEVNTQTTCSGSNCTSSGPGNVTLLPNGLSVSNTDVGEFGQGGMRGNGTGSITASGITGPVFHAFLYWHGPTNSTNANSNATVNFNGQSVTGTNIGTDNDNNWGFLNSQSYRADVTALVSGNGTYTLSNFIKENTAGACSPPTLPPTTDCVADINGVALIVFYDDGNSSNDRNVVLWNGNDSNNADGVWDEAITGVPYPGSGGASLDLVVGDGQSYTDGELDVNGTPIAAQGGIFQGDTGPNYSGNPDGVTGSLWDLKSFDITSLLTQPSNDLHITSPAVEDALSLVVAIANVPASAQPILLAPRAATHSSAKPAPTKNWVGSAGAIK
jgi:hypothetical protein